MTPLPRIMVAPNGARLGKADHPAIPETVDEIIACARACRDAGADGMHAHVRDRAGRHVLDAVLNRELLDEAARALPGFTMQITTECVGRYRPADQRRLVQEVLPASVSIALREITDGEDDADTAAFFRFCQEAGIGVQHILYDDADAAHLARLIAAGVVPDGAPQVLTVLGRYTANDEPTPAQVDARFGTLRLFLPTADWAVCAFGPHETACLARARLRGGKVRIGFENNRLNADGRIARDNADRVRDLLTFRDETICKEPSCLAD